jgi:hypothetical protein
MLNMFVFFVKTKLYATFQNVKVPEAVQFLNLFLVTIIWRTGILIPSPLANTYLCLSAPPLSTYSTFAFEIYFYGIYIYGIYFYRALKFLNVDFTVVRIT